MGDEGLRRALRRGRFAEARALLAGRNDPGGLIERARLAIYFEVEAGRALPLIARVVATGSPSEQLLARALRTCADPSAVESIDPAALAGSERREEIVYYLAMGHYQRGDLSRATGWIDSHRPQSISGRARFMLLRGALAAADGRFAERARTAAQVLDLLENTDEEFLYANAAQSLATIARDVPIGDGLERLEATLPRLSSDDGFTTARFHTIRALGWNRGLHGDFKGALRLMLRSTSEARSDVQRVFAHLDHASMAIFFDEKSITARAAFDVACECAENVGWTALGSDDVVALPLLVATGAELGEFDAATRYQATMERACAGVAGRFSLAHDGMLEALVEEATALHFADLDRKTAKAAAQEAYERFDATSFEWRAARMALLLLQLTRNQEWSERAEMHLEAYPESPFRRLLLSGSKRRLTRRQEQIVTLLRQGLDSTAIAERLGMSPNTVRIHTGRIFRFYAVKSRPQLIAKLASA
jgi:DNA-binding CsgD family transcriptional regulator